MTSLFNEDELAGMRLFYQKELRETLNKLEHIQSVLAKLDENGTRIDIRVSGLNAESPEAFISGVSAKKMKRKTRKKTGPKSVWGEFIIDTLKTLDRPLTYEDLIAEAIKHFKTPEEKLVSTRQAVVNSAFRLRKHHGEVETIGIKGQKEKYVGLIDWFEDNGNLKAQYKAKLPQ